MKIRTLSQFQDALDAESGWRFKEIVDLKTSVRLNGNLSRPTVIRAGTALLYAHWEGFVKASSQLYILFINGQRIRYADVKTPIVVMGIKGHLISVRESGNYEDNVAALDFIRRNMEERVSISYSGVVNTESNLSSKVFSNIAQSLCIATGPYEAKFKLIDESLVKRRNKIAHGEFLDISIEEWRNLADEVLALIRSYKTDIENAATSSSFKIAPAQ